jgi:CubicO group peptidase (beta-lactamase class C family)
MTVIDGSRIGVSTRPCEGDLPGTIAVALRRWPSAGVAVAVVGDHSTVQYFGHGVADVASGRRVSEDTVFRIGSLTKTMTAVAVMQLCEQGLISLDAPTSDYLRAFQLVPVSAGFGPATVRHLLTHTAGVGYWRRRSDLLLHPGAGSGVTARSVVPLPGYYRGGLTVDVEPGTRWAYSNHGSAALGQIVEDVCGESFGQYLRDHIFGPLGMHHTGLILSEHLRADLATGYTLRRRGLRPVRHHRLVLAPLTPVPGLRAPMVLHPDDPDDPRVYRVEFPSYDKTWRAVFTEDTPPRLLLDVMSFQKRPDWKNPRRWATGIAVAGAAAAAAQQRGRRELP